MHDYIEKLLEPETKWLGADADVNAIALTSIAISAKRIADTLEARLQAGDPGALVLDRIKYLLGTRLRGPGHGG